jgi:hypothetical protein
MFQEDGTFERLRNILALTEKITLSLSKPYTNEVSVSADFPTGLQLRFSFYRPFKELHICKIPSHCPG